MEPPTTDASKSNSGELSNSCEASNNVIQDATEDVLYLDNHASSLSPRSSTSSPDLDLSDIKAVNINDPSYNNIMSACSTAAQHIRQTITEVLNSRLEANSSSVVIEEITESFEESLKQKLEDFENAVKSTNLSSPPVQGSNAENPEETKCTVVPESIECTSQLSPDSASNEVSNPCPTVCADVLPKPVLDNPLENSELVKTVQDCEKNEKISETKEFEVNSEVTSAASETHASKTSAAEIISIDATPVKSLVSSETLTDSIVPSKTSSIENHSTEERLTKKSNKNSSSRKKGEKSIDQILKSLSNLPSAEEKLHVLCRKHSETLDELKSAELRSKQSERQVIQLSKEKEQLQAEHNRMILAKSKLESLCRELQRQNKAVKEESLLRIREEEEKRKEVASKFQTTLNEISNLMQENSKKNLQLKEENAELAQKLKTLVEHYEMWEKHMEKVVQQKDLEAQLAKAKHAKTNLQLKQETEKFLKEKQSLLENMSELQKKCTQLATNELQLRAELNDYTTKYEEFQSVLNKSNQVFASFKTDMETTSKKIKKLEKETNIWKQKWESSNNALLEMITDKQKRDKELLNAQQRVLTLEKLCRALQAERNDLQNQLNGQHITDGITAEAEQAC